jgi:hypothetical protein
MAVALVSPRPDTHITPPAQAVSSQHDSWRVKLGLLAFGLLLVLLMLEVVIRVLESRNEHLEWHDRPVMSYVPAATPDNRNFPYTKAKPPGVFRIIVLGDSFTFAGKVHFDDNFALRLQRMLNLNQNQPRVEVLNWGVPGFSTMQEEQLMKTAVLEYQPDLVLLEITLNDAEIQPYHVTHSSAIERRKDFQNTWLARHWKTYALLLDRYFNTIQNREYLQYHLNLFQNPETWNPFSGAIDKISEMSEHHHVPVLAFIFPMLSAAIDEHYLFAPVHEKIMAKLSSTAIIPLDLKPFFTNIPPERLQAIPGEDAHPNEIAHRIAADAIYASLAHHHLIPEQAEIKKLHKGGRRLPQSAYRGRIPKAD